MDLMCVVGTMNSRNNSQTLKRDLYENCKVSSRHGDVMFYCSAKRARWYLNKNLGTIITEDPLEVRLNFDTNGPGNTGDAFYLQQRKNNCVVCGDTDRLTRHHVVPISFRKYFPSVAKDHSYHDILPVCTDCHEAYEHHANEFKNQLAKEYNAPRHGVFDKEYYAKLYKCRGHARTLLTHKDKIPAERIEWLMNEIRTILNKNEFDLEEIAESEIIMAVQVQGEMIVSQLTSIEEFVCRWRAHFVDTMRPKYMPLHWSIKRIKR